MKSRFRSGRFRRLRATKSLAIGSIFISHYNRLRRTFVCKTFYRTLKQPLHEQADVEMLKAKERWDLGLKKLCYKRKCFARVKTIETLAVLITLNALNVNQLKHPQFNHWQTTQRLRQRIHFDKSLRPTKVSSSHEFNFIATVHKAEKEKVARERKSQLKRASLKTFFSVFVHKRHAKHMSRLSAVKTLFLLDRICFFFYFQLVGINFLSTRLIKFVFNFYPESGLAWSSRTWSLASCRRSCACSWGSRNGHGRRSRARSPSAKSSTLWSWPRWSAADPSFLLFFASAIYSICWNAQQPLESEWKLASLGFV